MKVTCHFNSYASGRVQFCEHFDSMKAAIDFFRCQVNDWMDGIGDEGKPDATMWVYPHTPEDTDDMSHGDYPMSLFSVGAKRYGDYTIRREAI